MLSEDELSHLLLSLLVAGLEVRMLNEDQADDLTPILPQDLLAHVVGAHGKRAKPLHAKVVYKSMLLNVFDIFHDISITCIPIYESQSYGESVAVELAEIQSSENALKGATFYLPIPVFAKLGPDESLRVAAAEGYSLGGDSSFVLVTANGEVLWPLVGSLTDVMDGLH